MEGLNEGSMSRNSLVKSDISSFQPMQSTSKAQDTVKIQFSFPAKLYNILEVTDRSIISWLGSGTGFRVNDMDKLIANVLPHYFNHSKFESFQRQLNLYGFKRILKGLDQGGYCNPNFQRGKPELLSKIRRLVGVKTDKSANGITINTYDSEIPYEHSFDSFPVASVTSNKRKSTDTLYTDTSQQSPMLPRNSSAGSIFPTISSNLPSYSDQAGGGGGGKSSLYSNDINMLLANLQRGRATATPTDHLFTFRSSDGENATFSAVLDRHFINTSPSADIAPEALLGTPLFRGTPVPRGADHTFAGMSANSIGLGANFDSYLNSLMHFDALASEDKDSSCDYLPPGAAVTQDDKEQTPGVGSSPGGAVTRTTRDNMTEAADDRDVPSYAGILRSPTPIGSSNYFITCTSEFKADPGRLTMSPGEAVFPSPLPLPMPARKRMSIGLTHSESQSWLNSDNPSVRATCGSSSSSSSSGNGVGGGNAPCRPLAYPALPSAPQSSSCSTSATGAVAASQKQPFQMQQQQLQAPQSSATTVASSSSSSVSSTGTVYARGSKAAPQTQLVGQALPSTGSNVDLAPYNEPVTVISIDPAVLHTYGEVYYVPPEGGPTIRIKLRTRAQR